MAHQLDGTVQYEQSRIQLSHGLSALAEQLRHCSQLADHFASIIGHGPIDPALQSLQSLQVVPQVHPTFVDDDAVNGRKRKAVVIEDDGKRKRKPKDPNAPKRPPSSYILFQNEIRQDIKKDHPELTNSELLAYISKMWTDLSEERKNRYNEICATAKEAYTRDKAKYDARSPEEKAAADAAAAAVKATKRTRKPRREGVAAKAPAAKPAAPAVGAEESATSDADAVSDDSDDDHHDGGDDDAHGDDDEDHPAEASEDDAVKAAKPPSKSKNPSYEEPKAKKQRR